MRLIHLMRGALAVALVLVTTEAVSAQLAPRWAYSAQYSTVLGVGDTGDFAGGFSWRGVTFDLERALSQNFTVGGTFGWHVLNDEADGTHYFNNGAVTGTALTYLNSVPLLLTGTYFMGDRGAPRPFIGGGVGTYWTEHRLDAGNYYFEEDAWHFGLMGEVGVMFPRTVGAIELSTRFHWAMEADGYEAQYLTFSLGFAAGY